jgi:hypothetical protein
MTGAPSLAMEMLRSTGRNGRNIMTGESIKGRNDMEESTGSLTGPVLTKGEAEGGTAIKPISASANEGSEEIVQNNFSPEAVFQEIFSLFPSTKAFKVERILFTFKR